MDGHSIAEDVKVALELKHSYEELVLAQQTDQTLPVQISPNTLDQRSLFQCQRSKMKIFNID